jgi:hypothetical protein
LEVLHQDTFRENKELTELMFSYNKIKAIARETFADLPKISYLEFDKNVCVDQHFGDHETSLKVAEYNEALEKCYANY